MMEATAACHQAALLSVEPVELDTQSSLAMVGHREVCRRNCGTTDYL